MVEPISNSSSSVLMSNRHDDEKALGSTFIDIDPNASIEANYRDV
jgi:hypothetical protein